MGQGTFITVPNPYGMQGLIDRPPSEVQSKPPMTSKQAKKQHLKNTREKKLTKQEERRILLELKAEERRREEKEKRERKALAVREKKRDKEQRLAEEKKKKGLPLVDVRPSQETLTSFFRGNGSSKKRDSTGVAVQLEAIREETPGTDSDTLVAERAADIHAQLPRPETVQELACAAQPREENATTKASTKPFKRFRTGCTPRKEDRSAKLATCRSTDHEFGDATVTEPNTKPQEDRPDHSDCSETGSRESSIDSELEVMAFDQVDSELWDLMGEERVKNAPSTRHNPIVHRRAPPQPSAVCVGQKASFGKENEPPKSTMDSLEIRPVANSGLNPAGTLSSAQRKPLEEASGNTQNDSIRTPAAGDVAKHNITARQAMPPPPVPVRTKASTESNIGVNKGFPKPIHFPASRSSPCQAAPGSVELENDNSNSNPPSCTQLLRISMADLVDLLPSPSQEVRELQVATAAPSLPSLPKPPVRRSQPLVPKPKPSSWKPPPPVWKPTLPTKPPIVSKAPLPRGHLPPTLDNMALFLSTQDITFSSQDIRELEDPAEAPSRQSGKPLLAQTVTASAPIRNIQPPLGSLNKLTSPMSSTGPKTGSVPIVTRPRASGQRADMAPGRFPPPTVTKTSQGHSALSHAARYGRRSSQFGTPQTQSSATSSAALTQDTPCRAGLPSARYAQKAVRNDSIPVEDGNQGVVNSMLPRNASARTATTLEKRQSSSRPGTPVSPPGPLSQTSTNPAPSANPTLAAHAAETSVPELKSSNLSASPPRKRMLTSSNAPILLAVERSRKTLREEQRKRELAEREAELQRRKDEEERREQETEALCRLQQEADAAMAEGFDDDDAAYEELLLDKQLSQCVYAAISHGKTARARTVTASHASQETDYGDLDLPWMTQPPKRNQGVEECTGAGPGPRPGFVSQETDYGDIDLDAEDIAQVLDQVDFTDDDYP